MRCRHTGADDTERNVVLGMSNDKKPAFNRNTYGQLTFLALRMIRVWEGSSERITENCRRFLERNTMLSKI